MVNKGANKKQNYSQGSGSHVETTGLDAIGHHVKKSKRGARRQKTATVYYLIVRLLPYVFALACLSLGSI